MNLKSMINKQYLILIIIMFSILAGCKQNPDKEKLKSQILELHQKLIDAHFEKNIDFFTQGLSDNFISVKDGEITRPTLQQIADNYKDYINNTTFSEYRDLQKPIIGFSEDGSIGWSIVQVKVMGDRNLEDGTVIKVDFVCAWLTLYENSDIGWRTLTEISTVQ